MSASNYATHVSTLQTPQSQKIPGTTQVENSAGGYAWQVDCWTRLDRFIILGSEGGSYYASEKQLAVENAQAVRECFDIDPQRTVDRIVELNVSGRAPKVSTSIFALAMLSGSAVARAAVSDVCRTASHLQEYAAAADKFRRWGRGLSKTIANWYTSRDADDLAFQMTKYQQRNGWSNRDLLNKVRPKPKNDAQDALFHWAVMSGHMLGDKKFELRPAAPKLLSIIDEIKSCDESRLCALISEHKLAREVIPTERLKSVPVWQALLEHMPPHAMLRNLGKMGSIGLLKPMSSASRIVAEKLAGDAWLAKSRVHPVAILLALSVYRSGHGIKGNLTWTPDSMVIDSLDAAFYRAFQYVIPTGKRHLLALDVSGSMGGGQVCGMPLSPREASAALAMVTVQSEALTHTVGFTGDPHGIFRGYGGKIGSGRAEPLSELKFSKRQSLADAISTVSDLDMGPTDCTAPMLYAIEHKLEVDAFVIYTDNETWAGETHPVQALRQYRQKTGINAKLIVVGLIANNFSIADPSDSGMMDVVGFDTNVPQIMADFVR